MRKRGSRTIGSAAVLLVTLTFARASTAQDDDWHSLAAPEAAFAVAGIPVDDDRSQILLRLIRIVHSAPDPKADSPGYRVAALLRDIDTLQNAAARLPRGEIALSHAANRLTRDLLEDALEAAGLRPIERPRNQWIVEPDDDREAAERRDRLASAGIDLAALAMSLNAGQSAHVAPATIDVPLPLAPQVWADTIFERPVPPRALFRAIIEDRNASLLYYGLCALTSETRAFLRNHPELLRWVYRERAGILAAYGSSMRVARSRVDLPGGESTRPMWEALAGVSTTRPADFFRQMLARDGGRLASLYNTIDTLDPLRQRFALGLGVEDAGARLERLRALYHTFVAIEADWSPSIVPFIRPMYDTPTLLQVVRITPEATLAAPASPGLWRLAFASDQIPDDPGEAVRDISDEGSLDAAGVAEIIALSPAQYRRERFEAFAFGQRAFARAPADQMGDVLVALRGFARYPAVMLALDRMGITSPAAFAAAARHALAIERIGEPAQQIPLHAQFQGALALVDRVRRTRQLPATTVAHLVNSLVALAPDNSVGYAGRLSTWVTETLLPVIDSGQRLSTERALTAALADDGAEAARSFTWEGVAYDVSIAASEMRRIERIRSKQAGNTIDAVLAFAVEARAIGAPGFTIESARNAAASLQKHAAALVPARPWPGVAAERVPDIQRRVSAAVTALAKIKNPADLRRASRIAVPLVETADYLLGEVLVGFAYAAGLGDPENLVGGGADLAHQHDFVVGTAPTPEARARGPWRRPRRNGKTVAGALLGLDLVLAPRALRQLASDRVPELPRINENDRDVFASSVVLMNPIHLTDAAVRRLATAIREGRRRVDEAGTDVSKLIVLAATARMSDSRRQLLAWSARHYPASLRLLFSTAELLTIGDEHGNATWRDAFGLTEEPLTGCYCARFPAPGPWEVFSGRSATGQLATRVPDLVLRVAEWLDELDAPAALLPWVLSLATYDFIHETPMLFGDDWTAAVASARRLSRERVEDYVASLTAQGPLRPSTSNQP